MYSNNKQIRDVAAVAAQIMSGQQPVAEELKGGQKKIDKNHNNKIDGQDFAILRGQKKANEEVEQIEEASTYKLGRAAAETKDFPIHHNGEHVGTLEFHTSAGKLHHRVASVKGVPHEKFIGHPDREKMTNAHVAKHEVEARKHFAKKIKEEVEQIDELSKGTLGSYVKKASDDAAKSASSATSFAYTSTAAKNPRVKAAAAKYSNEDEAREKKRLAGIGKAVNRLSKEETDQVEEGYYKDIDTNRKEDERLAAQKKKEVPFTPDKPAKKVATAGKFGYGYSAARHLARKGMASVTKEETEQVDEAITKTATGYIHHARPGVYGGSEKEKHVVDTLRGPKKSEIEAIEKEKKMKKFSEMLDLINSQGLKALSEMIKEEPDNETFTKELKDQEAKAAGKKKQADIAKGAVQAVKVEEDVEQLDELSPKTLGSYVKKAHRSGTDNSFDHGEDEYRSYGDPDEDPEREKEMQDRERAIANREKGVHRAVKRLTKENIQERSLTEPEMKKKEEIVKSMKKGLSGFKARYGDRAKEVIYATATKQAKGE